MIFFLLLGYTNNWVESTPTDATVANQIDDFNRKVRVDVAERLETYIGGFNAGDSNAGFYNVLFIEKASTPSTPAAAKGMLYGMAVGGKCELHWIDEDGDEKQITSGGVLKISAGDFDANSIDSDDYIDGSIDAVHLAADVIDETKIADEGIDSEHYNDGSIDAVHIANLEPDDYTTDVNESITLANKLIIKTGIATVSATSGTVTFDAAFPTAVISVVLSVREDGGTTGHTLTVANPGTTTFSWGASSTSVDYLYWTAIGY